MSLVATFIMFISDAVFPGYANLCTFLLESFVGLMCLKNGISDDDYTASKNYMQINILAM